MLTEEDAGYWDMLPNKMVIPNPLTKRPMKVADNQSKVAISVGRYDTQKGFDMLIEAWVHVAQKHSDWQLRIFGPGDNALYQRQADSLGLTNYVHCMGVSDCVYDEMAKASIYVLSSRYEGFGLVLIEAMAVGLPSVAFDCPAGPKDIISDHQDGIHLNEKGYAKLDSYIIYSIVKNH